MLDIELPEPEMVVIRKRVALDLGGIAKGFAVDRAIEQLMAAGCIGGQVNAGGDMRVFGENATPVWLRTDRGGRCIIIAQSSLRPKRSVGEGSTVGTPRLLQSRRRR